MKGMITSDGTTTEMTEYPTVALFDMMKGQVMARARPALPARAGDLEMHDRIMSIIYVKQPNKFPLESGTCNMKTCK